MGAILTAPLIHVGRRPHSRQPDEVRRRGLEMETARSASQVADFALMSSTRVARGLIWRSAYSGHGVGDEAQANSLIWAERAACRALHCFTRRRV